MSVFDATIIPEIRIAAADSRLWHQIKMAVNDCFKAHGIIHPSEIAQVAEFTEPDVILRLNQGEGISIFAGDELLDKQLNLFDPSKPHTTARLKELHDKLAASGISIARSPTLDDEFRSIVTKSEARLHEIQPKPPNAESFDEVYHAHHVTVVGEDHCEEAARLHIALKLPELAASNGALIMEGIPRNRQAMLDAYLASPPHTPVPPLLKTSLHMHTADAIMIHGNIPNPDYYSAERLLIDAKNAGVPVYAFDSDAVMVVNGQNMHSPPALVSSPEFEREPIHYRLLTMNQEASDVIAQVQKKHPGKILVNVGGSHSWLEQGIPGVGDYVGGGQLAIGNVPAGEKTGSEIIHDATGKTGDYLQLHSDPKNLKLQLSRRPALQSAWTSKADIPRTGFPTDSPG